MLLQPVGQIRVVVAGAYMGKPDFILGEREPGSERLVEEDSY